MLANRKSAIFKLADSIPILGNGVLQSLPIILQPIRNCNASVQEISYLLLDLAQAPEIIAKAALTIFNLKIKDVILQFLILGNEHRSRKSQPIIYRAESPDGANGAED